MGATNVYQPATIRPGDTAKLECVNQRANDTAYNKTFYCAYDESTGQFRLQGNRQTCESMMIYDNNDSKSYS
jgi:hypothetical protein